MNEMQQAEAGGLLPRPSMTGGSPQVMSGEILPLASVSPARSLSWEKHFPPIAELQEQLRAARQLTKDDA
jgi:hypothetical protein